MEDLPIQSTQANPINKTKRIPLGLSSFSKKDRSTFGQSLRVAIALINGDEAISPAPREAMPTDTVSIQSRLKTLIQDNTSNLADQLELLVRLDDLEGWKTSGVRHCAAYMNLELGISHSLAWEYLRAGRKLRTLRVTRTLFRAGKLSWSKIRLITRVATEDNECALCHAALDASVTQLETLCHGYQWQEEDTSDDENDRAAAQWEARSLTWSTASNGNTRICLSLPPETARVFLNSVEHSCGQLDGSTGNMAQRRADAAVLMAENSLQQAGRDIASADRYQVIVQVDANDLKNTPDSITNITPDRKPTIHGSSPIARETARRLSCDCTVSSIAHSNGEPVDIGQKSRIWPAAMARAIKARDQHCQWPGCSQTQHLQIHHIQHWADGGSTSTSNGACLCSAHHTQMHEGGNRLQRVDNDAQKLEEQFELQTVAHNSPVTDVERLLRNSRASFDHVRRLSPTRFRFRVVDSDGTDIRNHRVDTPAHSTRVEHRNDYKNLSTASPWQLSTHTVAEPSAAYTVHPCIISKQPAYY